MGAIDENYFNDIQQNEQDKNGLHSLEERFTKERLEWTTKISSMSRSLQKVFEINDLMVIVYTERQRLVEYYHYLLSLLSNVNRDYRKIYAGKYEYYTKFGDNQKLFPNEAIKNNKILSEMGEINTKKELLDIQSRFIQETLKSVDQIIWAISQRIKLEEISRGK